MVNKVNQIKTKFVNKNWIKLIKMHKIQKIQKNSTI